MQKILLVLVMATLSFCLTACASTPKVDTNRFSEAKKQIDALPDLPNIETVSMDLFDISSPEDTSGGGFKTLSDVCEQDAAIAAHYPILKTRLDLIEKRTAAAAGVNIANREDYLESLLGIRNLIDKIIVENSP